MSNIKELEFELFTGVGFLNQLFSLETAIYLSNVMKRKLKLVIKYPLCHTGSSDWRYGKFLDFFDQENLINLCKYGLDVKYTLNQNYKYLGKHIKFPARFSSVGIIDSCFINDSKHTEKIKDFLMNRKPFTFNVDDLNDEEIIYINSSNASRCFYQFYTTEENYKLMSHICMNLKLKDIFDKLLENISLPSKYNALHCRFGDTRHSTKHIEQNSNINFHLLLDHIRSAGDLPLLLMVDRKDSSILEKLRKNDNIYMIFTDELTRNIDCDIFEKNDVVRFLVEKKICENADTFIGHVGSTVSNHIMYNRYVSGKGKNLYSQRKLLVRKSDNYTWNTNKHYGAAISWMTFYPDNIVVNPDIKKIQNPKYITLTNDGYTDLTHNLLISMEKLGIERLLTVYCIGRNSYNFFKEKYPYNQIELIESEKSYLKTWVEYKSTQNKDEAGKKKWADITSYKFNAIHKELSKGNNIVFIDGDIVFEKNPCAYINELIAENPSVEFIVQNDSGSSDNDRLMCTGFFYMRANENMKKICNFENITNEISKFQNDQQYLRKQHNKMKHMYFQLNQFPNGMFYRTQKPIDPYIIHFNYDVGHGKINRMKRFNKWYKSDEPVEKPIEKPVEKPIEKPVKRTMNDLDVFIKKSGCELKQGSIAHSIFFTEFMKHIDSCKNVIEVGSGGFNLTYEILKKDLNRKVQSFDLGQTRVSNVGYEFMKKKFQTRLNFMKGNSKDTFTTETIKNIDQIDLIIIDGSYEERIIESDLETAFEISKKNNAKIFLNNVVKKQDTKYWNRWFCSNFEKIRDKIGDVVFMGEGQERGVFFNFKY